MVKSIGADNVIDYTKEDFNKTDKTYDIIFDTVGKITFSNCKSSLKPEGIFLQAGIGLGIMPYVLLTSLFGRKKAKIAATGLRPSKERTKDLTLLKKLMEEGKIIPVIDKRYPLEKIAEAHQYVDKGHKKGNVVITLKDSN